MFMKNKRNGFTLMELLAVVVILGITFLFIMPSVTSLIGLGERREIELIEERVLFAAKEYVNNYDSTFYNSFYKEGDTNYVYKSDLINAGLIDENEISKLNTFAGVKGELLSNDRIRYTVEYINISNNEYTNEELYLMIKNLQNQNGSSSGNGNVNSEVVDNLTSRIEELENNSNVDEKINELINKDNFNNLFLKMYPVGSIYVTNESTNPGSIFGGTWVTYGEGRTLVGVDSTQTEFAGVGLTGGEKKHQHKYGFQFGGFYYGTVIEHNNNAGLLNYTDESNYTIFNASQHFAEYTVTVNSNLGSSSISTTSNHYRLIANTSESSTLQP